MSIEMVAKVDAIPRGDRGSGAFTSSLLDYFGGASGRGSGSEAFALDYRQSIASVQTCPVDQFHILVGGSREGDDGLALCPLTLRYVDAFTSHGPFASRNGSCWLYTCRARSS